MNKSLLVTAALAGISLADGKTDLTEDGCSDNTRSAYYTIEAAEKTQGMEPFNVSCTTNSGCTHNGGC